MKHKNIDISTLQLHIAKLATNAGHYSLKDTLTSHHFVITIHLVRRHRHLIDRARLELRWFLSPLGRAILEEAEDVFMADEAL